MQMRGYPYDSSPVSKLVQYMENGKSRPCTHGYTLLVVFCLFIKPIVTASCLESMLGIVCVLVSMISFGAHDELKNHALGLVTDRLELLKPSGPDVFSICNERIVLFRLYA